ncbi:lysozyme C-like [Salminus brasiliensis]|uniref:lysozyme C-like n=1 Tax=Salminus brasiliensis TaxID=930266 RepID=UPI003B837987
MKFLVLLLFVGVANAKYFTRCELASVLQAAGMDGYAGVGLGDWMCLASAASSYNTQAINHNSDGSTNYGIFQIKDRLWCSNDQFPSYNGCRISCSQLLIDDISADIACAKVIANQQGILFWPGWQANCEARDVSLYVAGCEL